MEYKIIKVLNLRRVSAIVLDKEYSNSSKDYYAIIDNVAYSYLEDSAPIRNGFQILKQDNLLGKTLTFILKEQWHGLIRCL